MEQQQPTPQAPRQITGVVRNGRLEIELPPEWEGQVVVVRNKESPDKHEADSKPAVPDFNAFLNSLTADIPELPEHLKHSTWSREEIYRDEDLRQ